MKKIVIASTLCAALIFSAVLAAELGGFTKITEIFTENRIVEPTVIQPEVINNIMNIPIEQKEADLAEQTEEYDFEALLRANGCYEDEINTQLYNLINMVAVYSISDKEIDEIYKLVKSGYDLNKLLQVYEFTVHTEWFHNTDFVKQLYDKGESMKILGDYWVEDAFNALTDNRGGVLNSGQIRYYVENGLSVSDINAANIMSRFGKYTIEEILQDRLNQKSWIDIAKGIYPELYEADAEYTNASAEDIVVCVVKSRATGISPVQILSNSMEADQLILNAKQAAEGAASQIGCSKKPTQSVIRFAKEKLPSVDEEVLTEWLEQGHSIREMEQKKIKADEEGVSLENIINEEADLNA